MKGGKYLFPYSGPDFYMWMPVTTLLSASEGKMQFKSSVHLFVILILWTLPVIASAGVGKRLKASRRTSYGQPNT